MAISFVLPTLGYPVPDSHGGLPVLFEQPREKEYEWIESTGKPESRILRAKKSSTARRGTGPVGQIRLYRPGDGAKKAEYLRFVDLDLENWRGMAKFASEYGLLAPVASPGPNELADGSIEDQPFDFERTWTRAIRSLNRSFVLYSAYRGQKRTPLQRYLQFCRGVPNGFSTVVVAAVGKSVQRDQLRPQAGWYYWEPEPTPNRSLFEFDVRDGSPKEPVNTPNEIDGSEVVFLGDCGPSSGEDSIFNAARRMLEFEISRHCDLKVELRPNSGPLAPRWVPKDLRSALWLQFALAIGDLRNPWLRECACGRGFTVNPIEGRSIRREFCDGACRTASSRIRAMGSGSQRSADSPRSPRDLRKN